MTPPISASASRTARTARERRGDSAQRKVNYAEKIAKAKAMRKIEEEEKVQARPDWMENKALLPKRPPTRKP